MLAVGSCLRASLVETSLQLGMCRLYVPIGTSWEYDTPPGWNPLFDHRGCQSEEVSGWISFAQGICMPICIIAPEIASCDGLSRFLFKSYSMHWEWHPLKYTVRATVKLHWTQNLCDHSNCNVCYEDKSLQSSHPYNRFGKTIELQGCLNQIGFLPPR